MTPIHFLLEHREAVLSAFSGSPKEAWRKLIIETPEINDAMVFNTFKVIVGPFVKTCRFFDGRLNDSGAELNKTDVGLNKLNETIVGLNEKLNSKQELNEKLNTQIQELNTRLNNLEGLNVGLNNELVKFRLNVPDGTGLNESDDTKLNTGLNGMETDQVKSKLNIAGWTVAKSGKYYRAFRKIKGRVHGVHLGKSLDDAEQKILTKKSQIQGSES